MSQVSAAEMEMRRQQMIASLHKVSAAMRECTQIIDMYTSAAQPNSFASYSPMPMTAMPDPMHGAHFSRGPVTATMHQSPPVHAVPVTPATEDEKKKGGKASAKDGGAAAAPKEKKVKDPNAPKRPASAYIHFQNDVRDEIRKIHPELQYKEVLTLIAEKWKNLPTDVKQKYEETYQEQKGAYKLLDDAYKAGGSAPTPAAKAPVAAAASDSSDSDSESSDSDSTPNPVTKKSASKVHSTPQAARPVPVSTPVPASAKKDKKRKNKDEEAAVAATLDVASEKKKNKKKKDASA